MPAINCSLIFFKKIIKINKFYNSKIDNTKFYEKLTQERKTFLKSDGKIIKTFKNLFELLVLNFYDWKRNFSKKKCRTSNKWKIKMKNILELHESSKEFSSK